MGSRRAAGVQSDEEMLGFNSPDHQQRAAQAGRHGLDMLVPGVILVMPVLCVKAARPCLPPWHVPYADF